MLLYNDIISGDELFSDAYPITEVPGAFEVDCAMVQVGGDNIDIGANPSAEDGEEALEDGVETVNNVVHSFRLVETQFDKKSYMTYIKGYMKSVAAKLAETNPERVDGFKADASALVKKILGNIKDYEFYTGESMDPDGMVALLNYRADGVTPYFTFFADGVKSQKL
ncbi:Ribosome associating protein [Linderina macrospora]|uniref:Ribosome associating protein n=1 Tax=Linderina macrospora TaxID=4868 RepID=A0ACC1JB80_9FUNG|nr:Ribosome associating protein [Linderina macrospora]